MPAAARPSRAARVVVAIAAAGLLAGCGSGSPAGPRDAAVAFRAAWLQGDGTAACRLLAPGTAAEVVSSSGRPCPQGILDQDAPAAGPVQATQVWGGSAQVRLRGDTVFLSRFDGGWRVLAAGCVPRAGKPYDCELAGG